MQTTEQAASQIKRVYQNNRRTGEWMALAAVAERLDLSPEMMTAAIRHLMLTEKYFNCTPESNQKMLTDADHAAAVWIGCQWKHNICWF